MIIDRFLRAFAFLAAFWAGIAFASGVWLAAVAMVVVAAVAEAGCG